MSKLGSVSYVPSLSHRLLYTFLTGVVVTIIASLGLYVWSISEWLQFPGPYDKKWEGYNIWDFLGLMSFTLFGPVAFCIVFTSLQHLVRMYATHPDRSAHKLAVTASCVFLFGIATFGFYWGFPLLKCGFIFCVDSPIKQWKSANFRISEAGTGFETTIGMPLFVLGITLIGVQIAAFVDNRKNAEFNHREQPPSGGKFTKYDEPLLSSTDDVERPQNLLLKKYTPYNTHLLTKTKPFVALSDSSDIAKRKILYKRTWIYLSIILLWFLFCYVIATYIPNNWEYWYPSRIAEKARLIVTNDPDECKQWKIFTCPETPGAWMTTSSIKFNKHFNMKLFPSNAIFFLFISLSVLGAVIFRQIPTIHNFLSKKIRVPKPMFRNPRQNSDGSSRPWLDYERAAFFSGYELVMCFATLGSAYLFFHYWLFDHNYNGYWPYENPHISEVVSRTFGQLAVFVFSLLLFPAARSSPILSFFGVSWEAAIQYHRWLGVLFFLSCLTHMGVAYYWYSIEGHFPSDIWAIPQKLPTSVDNFTVPAMSWIVWISIITIGVISIFEPIRRRNFDLFLFAHHFTYMAMIPAIMWHAAAAWEYMLPGLAIWFADRLMRAYRSVRAVHLVSAHDASMYSGERFHFPSIFQPASIDRSLQTPDPIISIHHHKSYMSSSMSDAASSLSSAPHLSSLHALVTPVPVTPRIGGAGDGTSGSDRSPSSRQAIGNAGGGVASPAVFLSPSQGSLQSAASPSPSPNMPFYSNNNTVYDSLSPVFNNTGPGVRIIDRGDAGQFVELRIVNNHMVYFPGHYAFINVAEISLFEWHPFTIASPVHFCGRSEILFVIKTMGPNTWTQALYDYIATEQQRRGAEPLQMSLSNALTDIDPSNPINPVNTSTQRSSPQDEVFIDIPLTVSLDGPYGTPIDFSSYDVVILVGGGIGITPCKSIYESLLLSYLHDFKSKYEETTPIETNKRIHLMFSARDPSLFNIAEESLETIPYGPFSAQLFCDNPLLRGHHVEESPTQGSAPIPLTTNIRGDDHQVENRVMEGKSSRVCSQQLQHLIHIGRPDLEHEMVSVAANVDPRDPKNSDIVQRYYQTIHGKPHPPIDCDSSLSRDPVSQVRKLTSRRFGLINTSNDVVDNTSNHHGGAQDETKQRVLVFVCGPEGMSKHAEYIAHKYGWDYHTETFAL